MTVRDAIAEISSTRLEPLPLPSAAVLGYVARFGAGALYVITQPVGFPVLIGASQHVAEALAAARKALAQGSRSAAAGARLVGTTYAPARR